MTGVSNVELLDVSFYRGCCFATLQAVAVQRFVRAVRRGVLDVAAAGTEADKVVRILAPIEIHSGWNTSANRCRTCNRCGRRDGRMDDNHVNDDRRFQERSSVKSVDHAAPVAHTRITDVELFDCLCEWTCSEVEPILSNADTFSNCRDVQRDRDFERTPFPFWCFVSQKVMVSPCIAGVETCIETACILIYSSAAT